MALRCLISGLGNIWQFAEIHGESFSCVDYLHSRPETEAIALWLAEGFMYLSVFAFLIGVTSGSRALTGLVCGAVGAVAGTLSEVSIGGKLAAAVVSAA